MKVGQPRQWQIVLTSSTLMHEGFEAFFRSKVKPLAASEDGVGVLLSHSHGPLLQASRQPFYSFGLLPERRRARQTMELIKSEERDSILAYQVPGCPDERREVEAFVRAHRARAPIFVITQDAETARAVLELQVPGKTKIAAAQITPLGETKGWPPASSHRSAASDRSTRRAVAGPDPAASPPTVFDEGSVVVGVDGARHRLATYLSKGGEGTIFRTDTGMVCKVYHKDRRTAELRKKLELMVSMGLRHPSVCWPEQVVCDKQGQFVGYLMPEASGHELQTSVFIKPRLQAAFPHWAREHLVTLTQTILDAVAFLHSKDVLVGDINGRNILVKDEKTVYLVDADSYQVGSYRCSVGIPTFLPPELQGKDLKTVQREPKHEHFAVATLVFMLMMPGKPPYAYAGGTNPAANVKNRHFPYNLGGVKSGEKVPRGPWIYIWSNLTFTLKRDFHSVFTDGDRLSVADWQASMAKYANDLSQGFVTDEIFPSELKRLTQRQAQRQGLPWVLCTRCTLGYVDRSNSGQPGLCPNCRFKEQTPKAVKVPCAYCGTTYAEKERTVGHLRTKGRDLLCTSCRTRSETRTCKRCYRTFELSVGELLFFRRKGLSTPRSCKACRGNRS